MTALRDYVDEGPIGKRRLPVLSTARDEESDEADSDDGGRGRRDDVEAEAGDTATGDAEFDVEAFASSDLDVD